MYKEFWNLSFKKHQKLKDQKTGNSFDQFVAPYSKAEL